MAGNVGTSEEGSGMRCPFKSTTSSAKLTSYEEHCHIRNTAILFIRTKFARYPPRYSWQWRLSRLLRTHRISRYPGAPWSVDPGLVSKASFRSADELYVASAPIMAMKIFVFTTTF